MTRPPAPVPATAPIAIPISRASARTAGVAIALGGAAAWAAPGAAWAVASPVSISTSGACTFAMAPASKRSRTIRPRRGDGITTVALSVITSTSGWSSSTRSPGATSHRWTSASTTPSPMSGSSS